MNDREKQKHWFVIHSQAGSEERVKKNLEQRVRSLDASDHIFQVVIPTEQEIEVRGGQKRTVTKKVFPGYLLVEMLMDDKTWAVVRNTPGVTGFVSSQDQEGRLVPVPLDEAQVSAILNKETEAPRMRVGFSKGQSVRLVEGPFQDFVGVVDEINMEKGKVKVLISFFGRETPVELDYMQVERI
jgi:transcriptional antiterminator NusG